MAAKILKLELSPLEQAQAELHDVCLGLRARIFGALSSFKPEQAFKVECEFDRYNFRMDIKVNDKEHHISVQGRGGELDRYLPEAFEIVKKHLFNNEEQG